MLIVVVVAVFSLCTAKMKAIICLTAIVAVAVAYPAQEGAAYTNEAIRQAQTSHLIPSDAQIQKVRNKKLAFYRNQNLNSLGG